MEIIKSTQKRSCIADKKHLTENSSSLSSFRSEGIPGDGERK